ncbi:MAG TPA: gephyrin-like molybdotransferase Glp [Candidatus Eisenbacteria bacterium]|nr:gephyrin-like molybdotransferase Glp [Candidatus Eisenbacteria bacterium]
MTALLPWEEARDRVLFRMHPLPALDLPVTEALGLASAAPVVSPEDMPAFSNSAVDGFAVRSADIAGASELTPRRLSVLGHRPAGHSEPIRVGAGETVRIMTGAPIPEGADAVVMIEDTDAWDPAAGRSRFGDTHVQVNRPAEAGQHIRPRGESVQAGAMVLEPGARIRSAEVGLLSALGIRQIRVHPVPRVAVFSSGDEIVPTEEDPGPGKVRDSNRPALLAALRHHGFPAIDLGLVPDDEARIADALRRGARGADFVISSGGVSVGDRDLTHSVLATLGTALRLKVAMKPGKPQVFGEIEGVPVYGLPGNPVSSLVVFDVFVLPALRKLAGRKDVLRPSFKARLAGPIQRKAGRTEFLRVRLEVEDGGWIARSTGPQGSGILSSMTRANGYAILPAAVEGLEAGAPVLCMLWED